jgi:hypothetical protein
LLAAVSLPRIAGNEAWVSCGRPGHSSCLENSCQSTSANHEVRCCADAAQNGYQKKHGCEVWAESQFLSVGSGTGGCVHAATWEAANLTCVQDGARLCTVAELEDSCTQGTGCGHDADMIWASSRCAAGPEPEPEPEPEPGCRLDALNHPGGIGAVFPAPFWGAMVSANNPHVGR